MGPYDCLVLLRMSLLPLAPRSTLPRVQRTRTISALLCQTLTQRSFSVLVLSATMDVLSPIHSHVRRRGDSDLGRKFRAPFTFPSPSPKRQVRVRVPLRSRGTTFPLYPFLSLVTYPETSTAFLCDHRPGAFNGRHCSVKALLRAT